MLPHPGKTLDIGQGGGTVKTENFVALSESWSPKVQKAWIKTMKALKSHYER